MSLSERIRSEMTAAMKARESEKLSTLRMLQAALKNEQIEKGRELDDQEVIAIIRRGVKQRHDSIEQYRRGGREELAAKEENELSILETYLPRQMAESDVEREARALIEETGAKSKADMGRVMKELMGRHPGVIDGRVAQQVVSRLLS